MPAPGRYSGCGARFDWPLAELVVVQVIAHYEGQSEDEQFADIEAAFEHEDMIMMVVPASLALKYGC